MLIERLDYTPTQRRIKAANMMMKRPRSTSEIADHLMVCRRTARRIINDLSLMYPLFEPVPNRYQIDCDVAEAVYVD